MAKPISEQIAAAKARLAKEKAKINTLAAKEKTLDRKRDTRRKIVIGAAMLAAIEHEPALAAQLRKTLTKFVTRDIDRTVVADLLPPAQGGR